MAKDAVHVLSQEVVCGDGRKSSAVRADVQQSYALSHCAYSCQRLNFHITAAGIRWAAGHARNDLKTKLH